MTDTAVKNLMEYFEEVLRFLKEQQWIYNYPNTHILINKSLENLKPKWIDYFQNMTNEELNMLPQGIVDKRCPKSLQIFMQKLKRLRYEIYNYTHKLELTVTELPKNSSISSKKAHEIVSLTAIIHDICVHKKITIIIDVGAGLGYLSQLLHTKYNYKILGIEGNEKHYELAKKNQDNFYPNSKDFVKYVHYFITQDSSIHIKNLLKENFENFEESSDNVCIMGLHACADLSVTVLDIFLKLDFVISLVIMPCCYHRMELLTAMCCEEKFKYFPVSDYFKSKYDEVQGETFLRRPFLRLACQKKSSSWQTLTATCHEEHSKMCMFRAILQQVADEEHCDVKRLKRKSGKLKSGFTIEEYANNLKHTHTLIPKSCTVDEQVKETLIDDNFKAKLFKKWKEYEDKCFLVEILMAFQMAIQGVCEEVILVDRVQFLREKGLDCDVYKVADDRISSRCYALVASKVNQK